MKPKPFSALNHFTVPCATCAPAFMSADSPLEPANRVAVFRPYDTNVELEPRGKVQQERPEYRHSARNPLRGPNEDRPRACPAWGGRVSCQAMRPAARADFRDGSTWWVGPTTGSRGSRVFSPSPVL